MNYEKRFLIASKVATRVMEKARPMLCFLENQENNILIFEKHAFILSFGSLNFSMELHFKENPEKHFTNFYKNFKIFFILVFFCVLKTKYLSEHFYSNKPLLLWKVPDYSHGWEMNNQTYCFLKHLSYISY